MRAVILILAVAGALVACLAVVIGAGLMRLDRLESKSFASRAAAATRPAVPDESEGDEGPAPAAPQTRPTAAEVPAEPPTARDVFLAADKATVTGPGVVLVTAADAQAAAAAAPQRRGFLGMLLGGGGGGDDRRARGGRRGRVRPFEPYLGQWTDPDGTAEWTFTAPEAGKYAVSIVYTAAGYAAADGGVVVAVAGQTLPIEVRPPAGRRLPPTMTDAGTVDLPAGESRLTVRAARRGERPLMNLRSVRLFRVE